MPRTTPELSERKAAILRALVQLYIQTGEPVGSEALAEASGLRVSPATIRNELAALEELGFLTQPHTSAGRAPTDLAYRYYVDLLPPRLRLGEAERRAIVRFFDEALADVDEVLRGTTRLLSRLTRYAALALAPSPRESAIARAEVVRLGSAALLLVVFDSGHVDKRVIEVPSGAGDQDLDEASRVLVEAAQGVSPGRARRTVEERAAREREPVRTLLSHAAAALGSIEESAQAEHVFLRGVANIAAEEAFRRRETLRRVYEALEREQAILRTLREAALGAPVSVRIGHENPVPEMWETSVVAAPYVAGGAVGSIGVIGPTRMDYASAISAVREVAERLSRAVEALTG